MMFITARAIQKYAKRKLCVKSWETGRNPRINRTRTGPFLKTYTVYEKEKILKIIMIRKY
jgi:hypothetical protein